MWARITEIILGLWLIASHFLFQTDLLADIFSGLMIILFASLSFFDKLNKMHLLQIVPASWLFYLGYAYPTPWLPFYMQNLILIALCLLMFAIIPSNASDHPRPWKKFFKERSKH